MDGGPDGPKVRVEPSLDSPNLSWPQVSAGRVSWDLVDGCVDGDTSFVGDADVVVSLGGLPREAEDRVTVGALAAEYINTLNIDLFFMGVCGVHATHGLTTGDAEEAAIKRSISRRTVDTFVLASSEKPGTALSHRVVSFSDVTAAISDERNT